MVMFSNNHSGDLENGLEEDENGNRPVRKLLTVLWPGRWLPGLEDAWETSEDL